MLCSLGQVDVSVKQNTCGGVLDRTTQSLRNPFWPQWSAVCCLSGMPIRGVSKPKQQGGHTKITVARQQGGATALGTHPQRLNRQKVEERGRHPNIEVVGQ